MNRQKTALRFLWLTVAASVVVPLLLFVYVAYLEFNSARRQADDRLQYSLNVVQEHALKVLETIDRAIAETNEVISDLSDDDIRAQEPQLHDRLKKIVDSLPQVQAMSIIGPDGRQMARSQASPVSSLDLTDRDFFQALSKDDVGLYIGQLRPAIVPLRVHFNVARRRITKAGGFDGVIDVEVLPSYFNDFYSQIIQGNRDGGSLLVRYPYVDGAQTVVQQTVPFIRNIRTNPENGFYVGVSGVDGELRRAAYRRLPSYPIYALASVSETAVRNAWLLYMTTHMIIGVPATLLMLAISILALRKTQALQTEMLARERAEEALRQAQKMEVIGQLTGGIAHDFNNLLMVVIGGVDRLRHSLSDPRQLRTLDMIMSSAKRGENLIRHLLTFSRRQAISPTSVSVGRFFQQIEEVLHGTLNKNILLDVEKPAIDCAVRVDPSELELAMLNVCVNARDAMPNGGRLTLSAERVSLAGEPEFENLSGEFVAMRVTDTGSGISPDVVSRVFEPFFTTKSAGQGTGLGLSQVYGFAKQSGGTVLIKTASSGTTLTLLLPSTEAVAEAEPTPIAAQEPVAEHPLKARILVVDDTPDVAQITRDYLERIGHQVDVATDGSQALAFIAKTEVDLIVSDIVMPGGMDGLDVARRVQELYPEIPVILVTGYSASAEAALNEGFEVLRKPFNVERIAEVIETHLARRRKVAASV
jgi:two-component system NtrC family sensor kinase